MARCAFGLAHEFERRGDLRVRERPLVLAANAVVRQRGGDRVPGRIVLAVALRDRPLHDRADPLPDASRGLPLRRPDRQQHLHDIGGVDAVHALRADLRHRVVPQAGAPLGGGLAAVLPVRRVDPDDRLDGLLEGRGATGAVPGIAALGDDAGVGERPLPRACERDDRVGAEADVGGFSVEAYPLRPGLGEAAGGGRFHKKAQAVSAASIAVAAGNVDGIDEGGEESLGTHHGCGCPIHTSWRSELPSELAAPTPNVRMILFQERADTLLHHRPQPYMKKRN